MILTAANATVGRTSLSEFLREMEQQPAHVLVRLLAQECMSRAALPMARGEVSTSLVDALSRDMAGVLRLFQLWSGFSAKWTRSGFDFAPLSSQARCSARGQGLQIKMGLTKAKSETHSTLDPKP